MRDTAKASISSSSSSSSGELSVLARDETEASSGQVCIESSVVAR